ncbi:hypothetical protein L1987_64669 [Smallanthus sonchifolius]|uniref:Uncharacterized protein n=1 Tax=Smallanthus sonchifolius TaxID=185202 RepID=A0ACB9BSA6_9ASTR|nr:hypothetical protein L1987_64669 [Smallanthus sonchifolius]
MAALTAVLIMVVVVVPTHPNALSNTLNHATPSSSMVPKGLRASFNGLKALKALFSTVIALTISWFAMPPASLRNGRSLGGMKLEAEFWNLIQDSGESLAYTARYHELSLLVPHMVTPLTRATLEDAICLAATLTDNHVKAGTLIRKGAKKVTDPTTSSEPSQEDKPKPPHSNKKRNFAVVTPTVPINQVAPLA